MRELVDQIDWAKVDGLVPAVVQDARSSRVLMLAYMNPEALNATLQSGQVTFWSRSRRQLWTKGETSGNFLKLQDIRLDCDRDTLLISAIPAGPTCHRGTLTCFNGDEPFTDAEFLSYLEDLIRDREEQRPPGSYTTSLFEKGLAEISRKVGEEGVEVVVSCQEDPERTVEESADLLYHLVVLLTARGLRLTQVLQELRQRHTTPGE